MSRSKETLDVVKAAMALAARDVDLGIVSLDEIRAIPRTRFAPVERAQAIALLKAEGKSNRKIAEQIGVDRRTIDRIVNGGANAPDNGANAPPCDEPPVGFITAMPNPELGSPEDSCDFPAEPNEEKSARLRKAFLWRVQESIRFAEYDDLSSIEVNHELAKAATQAVMAWTKVAAFITERLK